MDSFSKRRLAVAGGAAALLTLSAMQHPSANIHIITHDVTDTAPRKIQAAIDLGIMAVSVLYTWTAERAGR